MYSYVIHDLVLPFISLFEYQLKMSFSFAFCTLLLALSQKSILQVLSTVNYDQVFIVDLGVNVIGFNIL